MSDLLARLRAMRGGAVAGPGTVAPMHGLAGAAASMGASLVEADGGIHFARESRLPAGSVHGAAPLGGPGLHPLLRRQAGAGNPEGPVIYLDTETTGLSGGAGTFAFLVGVGRHDPGGFSVRQLFLPGPEHEVSQLRALAAIVHDASAVVTYNGSSFDLPLLRSRFALNRLDDPFRSTAHLDLLTLARRLWRETLPDCSLGTVERHVLGARRGADDVPGFEVPARYIAWLRTHRAEGLSGVLSHNVSDIVALTALRARFEDLIEQPEPSLAPPELHGMGAWFERLGEPELALTRYLAAASGRQQSAWQASLLLKRLGRLDEATALWRQLGSRGHAAAWVELAKLQEHRHRDYAEALASVEAAGSCRDADHPELERRRARLALRLAASDR